MSELTAVLEPAAGVARETWSVAPRDLPLWLVAVDVGIGDARMRERGERAVHVDHVGATGWLRAHAVIRAAGEAVERYALLPPQADDPLAVDGDLRGEHRDALICSGLMQLLDGDAKQLTSTPVARWSDLSTGEELLLPIALTLDPVPAAWAATVDGSPSGTASGPSWDFAVTRALLETIEREAVLSSWATLRAGYRAPATAIARTLNAVPSRILEDVDDYLDSYGVSADFLHLGDGGIGGIHCAVTVLRSRAGRHPLLAVGARASASLVDAVASSLREALQVHSVLDRLERVRPEDGGELTDLSITEDIERAYYCLTEVALEHAHRWVEATPTANLSNFPLVEDCEDLTLEAIVNGLLSEGIRPLVSDLSKRLPASALEAGWRVATVRCLGQQAFRSDDTKGWTWNEDRMNFLSQRGGLVNCEWRTSPPHPLI